MANYIGAIDQGTTSTRFIVFDRSGRIVTTAQKEHEQIYPKPGWVEHNPGEIWAAHPGSHRRGLKAQEPAPPKISRASASPTSARPRSSGTRRPASRSTTPSSGRTPARPTTWPSIRRLGGQDRFRRKTGLPLATYFSGLKIKWILENVPGVRALAEKGDVLSATSTLT